MPTDNLVIAVAGGAVGSVLTLLSRYATVPAEVRHHDRQIADIDGDLDRYAADEYARLRNELPRIVGPGRLESFSRGTDRSKVLAHEVGSAISAAMQHYRDEQTARIREYRELVASETRLHWLYRRISPGLAAVAQLTTPEKADQFLNRWPAIVPDMTGKLYLVDPRHRSIEDATQRLVVEQESH